MEEVTKVFNGRGYLVCLMGRRDEADVIDDGGANKIREPHAVSAEDVGQRCHEEE